MHGLSEVRALEDMCIDATEELACGSREIVLLVDLASYYV